MTDEGHLHRIFLNNPNELIEKLYCRVSLKSNRGTIVCGGLLAIDPVTDTAVIIDDDVVNCETSLQSCSMTLVPNVNWDSLEVLDSNESVKNKLQEMHTKSLNRKDVSEDMKVDAEKLTRWLIRNGLSVERTGSDLSVCNAVIIEPPYDVESCKATNEIILSRVRSILQGMPSDFA